MHDIVQQVTDFVREHAAWAAPVVFVLAFAESLAFISLLVPAWGALVALGALIRHLQGIVFGEPKGGVAPAKASYLPLFGHLAMVAAAGIYLPGPLVAWFQHVARLLG